MVVSTPMAAQELIRVSAAPGDSTHPSLNAVPVSGDLAVVWQDARLTAPGLYFRRFSSDSRPLTDEVRFHATGARPVVAAGTDGRVRVAWLEGGTPMFALLDASGSVVRGPVGLEGNSQAPRLALGPANEANVVYEHRQLTLYYVVFRRFDADGNGPLCRTLLDNRDIIGGCRKTPDIATDVAGTSTVLWIDLFGFDGWRLTRGQVHRDGCRLSSSQTILCHIGNPCAGPVAQALCPVEPFTAYVFWQERVADRQRVLSSRGVPFDASSGEAQRPRAACGANRIASVVWEDNRDGNREIYFAQQRPDGTKVGGADRRLTNHPGQSLNPDVAIAGGNPAVVWQDDREGNFEIFLTLPAPVAAARFTRGDANADGSLDISDAVTILLTLFAGGRALPCLDAADADDSGALAIGDAIALLNLLFRGGPNLPPPFPERGSDPTPDQLGCDRPPA